MAGKQRQLMKAGQKCGHLQLLQRVRAPKGCSPATKKRWRVRCTAPNCGEELTVPEMYMRRKENPKTHCGCQDETLKGKYNREYRIYLMMRERTRNPTHPAYPHYFANGIDICDEWYPLATGFELFFKDVGPRKSKDHTLDRIDNKRGYEPGNVRWATPVQQRVNQGDRVAGYTEAEIKAAGYTREEFTALISKGKDEDKLIKGKSK